MGNECESFSEEINVASADVIPATESCKSEGLDTEATIVNQGNENITVAAEVDQTEAKQDGNKKTKRKKRRRKADLSEQRLLGRRSLCKSFDTLIASMMKTVKMRILARHLDSKRGLDDADLTKRLEAEGKNIVSHSHVLDRAKSVEADANRKNLKDIIVNVILLQEETYSLEESKLDERVLEYEKGIIEQAEKIDLFDSKVHDTQRAHNCDIYRVVLDAAWRNNEDISLDEAELLQVLRDRLDISGEDHRLISAHIGRFPKKDGVLHSRDEIHDARKELQRDGLLWSYRDEANRNIDIIPVEVAEVLRKEIIGVVLQKVNYIRLLSHDCLNVSDLKSLLVKHNMDRNGSKQELISRVAQSDISPFVVLDSVDRNKLSDMCRIIGLPSSGKKEELCNRIVEFYDDLTFEERETQDEREEWYNNYELLASRSYADLRAKKLITKDLDVEHQFEKATDYLFEELLNVKIDNQRKVTKADGRLPMEDRKVLLWDCKSVEKELNLQDYLESQFDGYLRKERENGNEPLAFLVIAPAYSSSSIKVAYQYKAKTNWDIALIQADALKHIAEHWDAQNTEQPFPVGLFNRTEVIDVKLADFLLSLA